METDHQEKPIKLSSSSSSPTKNNNNIEVVIVPFPAHSHLSQLFHLSHIISSYNTKNSPISVHFVGSSLHNSQVKSRLIHALNPNSKVVEFHDFPNPPLLSLQSTDQPKNPNFPSHLDAYFVAYVEYLRPHVATLLAALSRAARRVVVVHDTLTSSAVQDSSSLPNAESYVFHCVSAISSFSFLLSMTGDKMEGKFPSSEGCFSPRFEAFLAHQIQFLKTNRTAGKLHNTSRVIESDFLDLLLEKQQKLAVAGESAKRWAVGPLKRSMTIFNNKQQNYTLNHGKGNYCLEWLNKQEPNSVLYVCFGTTTIMEDEQIRELALGLEQIETKFIWVSIDAEKFGGVSDGAEGLSWPQLPLGFEERVEKKGMGMVVREWAPQLEILGHPSTGGFLSHCGWNSCLESLSLGVPIAAWPMHSDQPMNAALVTDFLKAGLVMKEWVKREELVSSSVIAEVVKRLMKSKEGDEIRKRTEDLGSELRKCTEEGGVSRLEMDSFVAHITRRS